jgi:hypothetical protein
MEKILELIDVMLNDRAESIIVSSHVMSKIEVENMLRYSIKNIKDTENIYGDSEHVSYFIINTIPSNPQIVIYENAITIYDNVINIRYSSDTESINEFIVVDGVMEKFSERLNNAVEGNKSAKVDKFFELTTTNLKLDRHFKLKNLI